MLPDATINLPWPKANDQAPRNLFALGCLPCLLTTVKWDRPCKALYQAIWQIFWWLRVNRGMARPGAAPTHGLTAHLRPWNIKLYGEPYRFLTFDI